MEKRPLTLTRAALCVAYRQDDREKRAASLTEALCLDGTTVQLDKMTRYSQAEAQATVGTFQGAVALYERIEDASEKFRFNSNAAVAHGNANRLEVRIHT